ncbi:cytochrome c oxidase subunit 7A1, mitochondrial-like [Phlebotomus argentipes]|uniref:cytochrome c oxidase subunit 7A1, mitochondrial-like n=1 Tax=Phlebotomus argentipes TaxID=94469 RepID=UPI0028936771|nr:cytochrome c oxidase subunit 7A1, mitochondrial-like [Phlebotomus argentipes]
MALPENLVRNYKKFQEPNGVPVFLKGGPLDKVLFGTTVFLCGVGILCFANMVYTMGFKKKQA